MGKTVVFINGAWMTPASWENFTAHFTAAGYECLAPAWPYMDRPLDELRNDPAAELTKVTVDHIADHYENIINTLPHDPLIVGHSFGGLIAQMLLSRNIGSAGVAIDPAPMGGVFPDLNSVKNLFPVLSTFDGWDKLFTISLEDFKRTFANYGTEAEQVELYDAHVVPCPGRIFFQAATWIGTWVDPQKRLAPLLLIAGGEDKTVAPQVVHAEYSKQKNSPARTDLKDYPGRTHFQMAQPGWEQVAQDIVGWHAEVSAPNTASTAG